MSLKGLPQLLKVQTVEFVSKVIAWNLPQLEGEKIKSASNSSGLRTESRVYLMLSVGAGIWSFKGLEAIL